MSNGVTVTETDRDANDRADKLAQAAVETHRVEEDEVDRWFKCFSDTQAVVVWIARATQEANNQPDYPFQDSEVAR